MQIEKALINDHSLVSNVQLSPAISNSEGTGQKVRDSVIFEIVRLRDYTRRNLEIARF